MWRRLEPFVLEVLAMFPPSAWLLLNRVAVVLAAKVVPFRGAHEIPPPVLDGMCKFLEPVLT